MTFNGKFFIAWAISFLLSSLGFSQVKFSQTNSQVQAPASDGSQSACDGKILCRVQLDNGETTLILKLEPFFMYGKFHFHSAREKNDYYRIVHDVKKTLPLARELSAVLKETCEYLDTLPTEKAKRDHLKKMEKYIWEAYKPRAKRLTSRQGLLLIRLVDRECNSSSYLIIEALMGSFKAFTYNAFASLFGASLKTKYDPKGRDIRTERIINMIDQGYL